MRRSRRIESLNSSDSLKDETKNQLKLITAILKKEESIRSEHELDVLKKCSQVVGEICKRQLNNKRHKEREQEIEDISHDLEKKCKKLASIIENSKSLIIYSGAGISTAASIPDYRGPNGVWTLLKQGKLCRTSDLSLAEPTFTHMAITELYRKGYVKRVVSQNCDGLHLRSGMPRSMLSELHGNMYIEVCKSCHPRLEYLRLFDVTEKTAMRRHKTNRCCHQCHNPLHDTIIHFGEKSPFQSPHNWKQILCLETAEDSYPPGTGCIEIFLFSHTRDTALCLKELYKPIKSSSEEWSLLHCHGELDLKRIKNYIASSAANKADIILCLGSSLKVLKKYDCLWAKHKSPSEQPKLVIVNLQWTPKDKHAMLKINGRCDEVMLQLMKLMNIQVPKYDRYNDPLFHLCTPLLPSEQDSMTKILLTLPPGFVRKTQHQLRFKVERRLIKKAVRNVRRRQLPQKQSYDIDMYDYNTTGDDDDDNNSGEGGDDNDEVCASNDDDEGDFFNNYSVKKDLLSNRNHLHGGDKVHIDDVNGVNDIANIVVNDVMNHGANNVRRQPSRVAKFKHILNRNKRKRMLHNKVRSLKYDDKADNDNLKIGDMIVETKKEIKDKFSFMDSMHTDNNLNNTNSCRNSNCYVNDVCFDNCNAHKNNVLNIDSSIPLKFHQTNSLVSTSDPLTTMQLDFNQYIDNNSTLAVNVAEYFSTSVAECSSTRVAEFSSTRAAECSSTSVAECSSTRVAELSSTFSATLSDVLTSELSNKNEKKTLNGYHCVNTNPLMKLAPGEDTRRSINNLNSDNIHDNNNNICNNDTNINGNNSCNNMHNLNDVWSLFAHNTGEKSGLKIKVDINPPDQNVTQNVLQNMASPSTLLENVVTSLAASTSSNQLTHFHVNNLTSSMVATIATTSKVSSLNHGRTRKTNKSQKTKNLNDTSIPTSNDNNIMMNNINKPRKFSFHNNFRCDNDDDDSDDTLSLSDYDGDDKMMLTDDDYENETNNNDTGNLLVEINKGHKEKFKMHSRKKSRKLKNITKTNYNYGSNSNLLCLDHSYVNACYLKLPDMAPNGTIPGWFGRGMYMKRFKKKKY